MTRILSLLTFLFVLAFQTKAQELQCEVSVNADAIQLSNKQVFLTLQNAIKEFMNGKKWTDQVLQVNEKIKCNLVLAISEYKDNELSATIYVRSTRPVYNTAVNSGMMNLKDDKVHFKYIEFSPLEYSDGVYINELTTILAYYAYMIIGNDYDSYSEFGGTTYFNKAMDICNSASSSSIYEGWKMNEKNTRNRYFQVNDILESKNEAVRTAFYNYHRLGLDVMIEDQDKGLSMILSSLQTFQKVHKSNPSNVPVKNFCEAKQKEIIDLFNSAPSSQKEAVKTIMCEIDVTNCNTYNLKLQ